MKPTRRQAIGMAGGLFAALAVPPALTRAEGAAEIAMGGRGDGARVWFDPVGLVVRPGQAVRWVNRDEGNTHTATAYHPSNFDKPGRIPATAEPWDSDYLLPSEEFSIVLTEPGVYDFFCVPHEHAGMVGRIVVGEPSADHWRDGPEIRAGIPEAALQAFPPVEEIMRKGVVRRA